MKRFCSLILSMAMALSCMQMSVFAADVSATEGLETVVVTDTVSEPENAEVESSDSQEAEEESPEAEEAEESVPEAAPAAEESESAEAVEEPEAAPAEEEAEVVEAEEPELKTVEETEKAEVEYVLMNISYDEFYKADVNNDVPVDAFTSATKAKTRTGSLAAGSYHVDSKGSDITGITFPVKVGEGVDLSGYTQVTDESSVTITVTNRGQTSETTYTGKEALFESASHSYYVLDEEPAYYKELTADAEGNLSFGKVQGDVKVVADGDATLDTESSYGDYEMEVYGLPLSDDAKVYAVIVSTREGSDYGLRHLENIWLKTKLAWCTGFTKAVHSCPTSSAHYAKMMGQTINKVTYYTSDGIYVIDDLSLYVPVKFGGSVSVADAMIADRQTAVTVEGLPSDYDAVYSVDGLDVTVEDEVMTFPDTAKKGKYTLTVSDKNGKYADLTAIFMLKTDVMPAVFDASKNALVAAKDISEDDFANYIKLITSVSVNGKSYAVSGRGSVKIVKEDGFIDLTAAPIAQPAVYELVVSADGYNDLPFTLDTRTAQTITIDETSYSKTYGDKAFNLNATADSALSYESSNTKVVTVDSAGEVTIKGAGNATITITAGETDTQKAATETVEVTVAKAKQTVSVTKSYTKTLGAKAFTLKPSAKGTLVFKSSNTKVATVNTKGKVTIKGVGTTKITIYAKATSNYEQSSKVTVTIKVNPKGTTLKSVKSSAKKKLTVKWKKNANVTGYQIQYSTNKNFKNAKKVTVKGAKNVSKTLSKLTSKKKYYVRIRTYKTVSKTNYYSSWSTKSMNAKVK